MNIKNKLFATLIMSLLAFGGGGYFLYYQFSSASQHPERWIEVQYQQPNIVAPVKLGSGAISKARMLPEPDNTIISDLNTTTLPSGSGTFDSHSSVSSGSSNYAYSSPNRRTNTSTDISYGGTNNLLAYSSGSSSKTSTMNNISESGSGISSSLSTTPTIGPMAVPYNNNNPPQALVDPGGDPDPKSRIPVGEGWWFVLMLAVIYGFYRKFR